MPNAKESWFVTERSEALAGLLLTSRDDVWVQKERTLENGADFLVGIKTGERISTRLFVAQVKGTTSSNPADWMPSVQPLFNAEHYLPACIILANVRENTSVYSWLAEPVVEASVAKLVAHVDGPFQPLDAAALSLIVEKVKAWYDALPKTSIPATMAAPRS